MAERFVRVGGVLSYFTRHRTAANLLLVVLIALGIAAFPRMRAQFFPDVQYFTTRGYAILQVNYRGSTGYGRAYMLKLRGGWGKLDREDAVSGAKFLADTGRADPRRLVIEGGSAGGTTVLQALIHNPGVFRAGVCLFGVSNMFTLASDTHKFEERYLDTMLGPLPEARDIYRERSAIFFADKIVDPIIIFQGDIDQVVPRDQSDTIVESLRKRGIPHEYHVYEGEGHGWRKSETIEHYYEAVERFLRQHVIFA
ncbi:MAG: prolyl oligopeptidase family serine peptidase [Anaerolineales bacterium]